MKKEIVRKQRLQAPRLAVSGQEYGILQVDHRSEDEEGEDRVEGGMNALARAAIEMPAMRKRPVSRKSQEACSRTSAAFEAKPARGFSPHAPRRGGAG